jgi:tetratricopeptide (TPR) repeat protein
LAILARRAYQKGEWDRTAALARRQLKRVTGDTEALRLLARASARLGRDDAATAIYKDRLGAERMQAEDHFLFGLMLVRLGQNETALQVLEKAAREDSNHSELLASLAQQALALGRLELADATARNLSRRSEWEARGLLLLGEVQHLLDNPSGASLALEQGLRRDPAARGLPLEPGYYRRLLARTWLKLGRSAEAREQLEMVLRRTGPATSDADRECNWLLSRAFLQEGRLEDASAALKQAGTNRAGNPLAPEPSPFVGTSRCTECHADISRTYQRTRHARSFHRGSALHDLPLPDGPLADPDDPNVTLTFRRDGPQLRLETRTDKQLFHSVIEYAFGTPERYLTMIGRDEDGTYRGVRLSYYHTGASSGWCRTAGDVGMSSDPNEIVRGRPIDVRDGVVRCLHCHVTRPREFRNPPPDVVGPEAADSAIGCERCHGPGGNHIAAITAQFSDPAIVIVRRAPAQAAVINLQCSECHTVDIRSAVASAPDDPHFVRSPGMTLTFSRCFAESSGNLSCLTCHDPHGKAERLTSLYESKCLACHSSENSVRDNSPFVRARACKVNLARDCVHCHMPKVPVPELHASLTDHFIRVHRQGNVQQ